MFPSSGGLIWLLIICTTVSVLAYPAIQGDQNHVRSSMKGTPVLGGSLKHHKHHVSSIVQYGPLEEARRKRSAKVIGAAVLMGLRAMKNVFLEATRIPSGSPFREYRKKGGYSQAVKDFYSFHPQKIQGFTTELKTHGRTGQAGNYQLILRYNGSKKDSTLEIRRLTQPYPSPKQSARPNISGRLTDKIMYPEIY